MTQIVIHKAHALDHEQVRASVEKMAAQVRGTFHLAYHWEGNSLHFDSTGVNGRIDLEPSRVSLHIRLGWWLLPMKSRLEREIHRHLDELLPGA